MTLTVGPAPCALLVAIATSQEAENIEEVLTRGWAVLVEPASMLSTRPGASR